MRKWTYSDLEIHLSDIVVDLRALQRRNRIKVQISVVHHVGSFEIIASRSVKLYGSLRCSSSFIFNVAPRAPSTNHFKGKYMNDIDFPRGADEVRHLESNIRVNIEIIPLLLFNSTSSRRTTSREDTADNESRCPM